MGAMRVVIVATVVLACTNGLGAQNLVQVPTAVVVRPLLDHFEHAVVDLAAAVSETRMVEHAHAVVEDLFDGHVWVVPRVNDPRSDVLQDSYGNLTSGFVQDVGEMILGKHAVGGVSRGGNGPDLVLMLCSCVDDRRRSTLELC